MWQGTQPVNIGGSVHAEQVSQFTWYAQAHLEQSRAAKGPEGSSGQKQQLWEE
jgi:hypothetical protein